MSLLSRLFSSSDSKKTTKKGNGNAQHDAGAGPALAAHSKDAKSSGATGQNPAAAKKPNAAAAKKPAPAAAKKASPAAAKKPSPVVAKKAGSAAKSKQGSAKKG